MPLRARCAVLLFVVSLAICPFSFASSKFIVRHISAEDLVDARQSYFIELLNLALKKGENKFGAYKLMEADVKMFQDRAVASLVAGNHIDITWTATSSEREKKLRPIRIPLMKGLAGFRVMVIDKDKPDLLSKVKHHSDLRKFVALQGHDWPDTRILRYNGVNVATDYRYLALFDLIDQNRYDYFPRAMLEAWAELSVLPERELMIDQHILFVYPSPIYYFVSKKNLELVERLEYGLASAIADGSFENLLRNHPAHKEAFDNLNIEQRRIFHLNNPDLPEATPLDHSAYWYRVSDLSSNENE